MIKILYVLAETNLSGGAYIATINTILGLLENDVHVTLVTYKICKGDPLLKSVQNAGCNVILYESDKASGHIPARFTNHIQLKIDKYTDTTPSPLYEWVDIDTPFEIIKHSDAQIIVIPVKMCNMAKRIKCIGKRVVVHVHGSPPTYVQRPLDRCIEEIMWGNCIVYADLVCPVSKTREHIIKNYYMRNHFSSITPSEDAYVKYRDDALPPTIFKNYTNIQKIRHMYNAVTLRMSHHEVPTKSDLNIREEFIVISVSRLDVNKKIDDVLRGYAKFLSCNSGISSICIIIGNGHELQNLRDLVEDLEITRNVEFLGHLHNPHDYVAVSDVYVTATKSEGYGLSIAEASLCGIPIIAPDTKDMRESTLDGRIGLLFDPENIDELAECMQKIYDNSHLRNKMGSAGREFVRENLAPKVIGRKLLDLYAECGILNEETKA